MKSRQAAEAPSRWAAVVSAVADLLPVPSPGAPARRRAAFALAAFLALTGLIGATASSALAAGDANQAICPEATEASPGFRTYLPDCRAYELASPPYTAGSIFPTSEVQPTAISPDGDHVLFAASGAFAGAENNWLDGLRNNFNSYELSRTALGWQATVLTPSGAEFPTGTLMAATPDLTTTLWGLATTRVEFNEDIYLRNASGEFRSVGAGVGPEVRGEELGPGQILEFRGASSDLRHTFYWIKTFEPEFRTGHNDHSNLWPGDTTAPGDRSLYEYNYSGSPQPEPLLVGVRNNGPLAHDSEAELISNCGTALGSTPTGPASGTSAYNAVSEDGETVFFTAAACGESPPVDELYARLGGAHTVPISEPSAEACAACDRSEPAAGVFQGASRDGSEVFFTSRQKLFAGADGEAGENLYEYDFEGEAGHQAVSLLASDVSGISRISEDGSSVYFTSKAQLTGVDRVSGRSPEEAEPTLGAENLYLSETASGQSIFVATLLTPEEEATIEAAEATEVAHLEGRLFEEYETSLTEAHHSFERGEISEAKEQELEKLAEEALGTAFQADFSFDPGPAGPSGSLAEDRGVWRTLDERPVQATTTGGFLLFPASAHLTGEETGLIPQLFRYDAAARSLVRVSVDQSGRGAFPITFQEAPRIPVAHFGAVDLPTAAQSGTALTESGLAFFTSGASLVPQAEPGSTNVYEYRDGTVYLISGGSDASKFHNLEKTVQLYGTDSSGADAFFTTATPLVPQDTEPTVSLYDARVDGGFPAPATSAACQGELCQGAPSPGPVAPSPGGTSTQIGPGNPTPPKPRKKHHKKKNDHKRRHKSSARRAADADRRTGK